MSVLDAQTLRRSLLVPNRFQALLLRVLGPYDSSPASHLRIPQGRVVQEQEEIRGPLYTFTCRERPVPHTEVGTRDRLEQRVQRSRWN